MTEPVNKRLLRITTVPISLKLLLAGQPRFFMAHGFDVLTVSADGPEVERLKKDGVAHLSVPMTRRITPLNDFISLLRLIGVIRKFRPQIVHTHTPKAGLLGMLAAYICRVPVRMHTVAGLPLMEAKGWKRKLLMLTEKITYTCATNVYPNSTGLKDFIEDNVSTNTPIKIIGKGSTNGIDTSFFSKTTEIDEEGKALRLKFGFKPDNIVFSFVGRIVKDKGIGELLTAFRTLKSTAIGESLKLLLIGPFEQDLDPLDKNDYEFLHQHPDIVLAGFQHDIRPFVAASDIFVFPSYREGFPNVVMQACCLEVPCIVSDINGCNEIISREQTGLIVPTKDATALAAAMHRLATDSVLRNTFAGKTRRFVVENFDQQFVWGELLKEYERLLNLHSNTNR
jgi:glycosyltransferase involved in cell wall biosynthesis